MHSSGKFSSVRGMHSSSSEVTAWHTREETYRPSEISEMLSENQHLSMVARDVKRKLISRNAQYM